MRLAILMAFLILSSTSLIGQEFPKPELTEREFPAELRARAKPVAVDAAVLKNAQEQDLRNKIEQPIDLVYDKVTWREVETDIEKKLGINVVLTSSARDDSLTEDEPITCSLKNVTAKNALRVMLRNENATFVLQDNVLKIISMDDAEDPRFFNTRFINLRSLLARIKELEKDRIGQPRKVRASAPPLISVIPIVGQADQKTKPAQATDVTPTNALSSIVELNTAESLLIDLTQATVQQYVWEDATVSLKILGGFAVVNCSESLGDELEDFFAELGFYLTKE